MYITNSCLLSLFTVFFSFFRNSYCQIKKNQYGKNILIFDERDRTKKKEEGKLYVATNRKPQNRSVRNKPPTNAYCIEMRASFLYSQIHIFTYRYCVLCNTYTHVCFNTTLNKLAII